MKVVVTLYSCSELNKKKAMPGESGNKKIKNFDLILSFVLAY